jgi:hypothetical protein
LPAACPPASTTSPSAASTPTPNQAGAHERLLRDTGDAVKAFLDDLKRQGNHDRVTLMAFSEFGRRVKENGSGGTDHGAAAPLFLAGAGVKAGLHGKFPGLADKDLLNGDVRHTTDFRSVYATRARPRPQDRPQARPRPGVPAAGCDARIGLVGKITRHGGCGGGANWEIGVPGPCPLTGVPERGTWKGSGDRKHKMVVGEGFEPSKTCVVRFSAGGGSAFGRTV